VFLFGGGYTIHVGYVVRLNTQYRRHTAICYGTGWQKVCRNVSLMLLWLTIATVNPTTREDCKIVLYRRHVFKRYELVVCVGEYFSGCEKALC